MRNIILGAGVTGLSAGIKTGFPIYEALDRPGGICRSYYRNGYRFENGGGHWIFGPAHIKNWLGRYSQLNHFDRKASVYLNQYIDYPIQKHFAPQELATQGSMKHWLSEKFSSDLCQLFFFPFNKKYTAGLYDDIIQDDPAKNPQANESGYNAQFCYPSEGLDVLVDRMANDLDIKYNKEVIKLDINKKIVTFQDGENLQYDKLISTIPLKETLQLADAYKNELPHTSVLVLNIGADKGADCPSSQWVYIPDPKCEFFRVGFYSNVDPSFAPTGKVSIYVERAFTGELNTDNYQEYVVAKLQKWGWIGDVDVIDFSWIKCGYTWLTKESKRQAALDFLKDRDIYSIGRYGKWKFQGIAESINDGLSMCI